MYLSVHGHLTCYSWAMGKVAHHGRSTQQKKSLQQSTCLQRCPLLLLLAQPPSFESLNLLLSAMGWKCPKSGDTGQLPYPWSASTWLLALQVCLSVLIQLKMTQSQGHRESLSVNPMSCLVPSWVLSRLHLPISCAFNSLGNQQTNKQTNSLLCLLHKGIQCWSSFKNNECILLRLSSRLAMLTVALLGLRFPESHYSTHFLA